MENKDLLVNLEFILQDTVQAYDYSYQIPDCFIISHDIRSKYIQKMGDFSKYIKEAFEKTEFQEDYNFRETIFEEIENFYKNLSKDEKKEIGKVMTLLRLDGFEQEIMEIRLQIISFQDGPKLDYHSANGESEDTGVEDDPFLTHINFGGNIENGLLISFGFFYNEAEDDEVESCAKSLGYFLSRPKAEQFILEFNKYIAELTHAIPTDEYKSDSKYREEVLMNNLEDLLSKWETQKSNEFDQINVKVTEFTEDGTKLQIEVDISSSFKDGPKETLKWVDDGGEHLSLKQEMNRPFKWALD